MKTFILKITLLLALVILLPLLLQGQLAISLAKSNKGIQAASKVTKFDSYRGLVMTGYQGWFNVPNDGANRNWTHWDKKDVFSPGYCTVDFWPEMTEYPKKYPTSFKFPDGSPAFVFSSYDSSTVDLHYKWMADYGIDGAFMQRFTHDLADPLIKNHYHVIFDAAMKAARKYNRAITIRYDITGISKGNSSVLLADLDAMMAKYHNFDREHNPTFLYHNGKPLIAFGGVGFRSNDAGGDIGNLDEAEKMIAGFRQRGFSILMRVPAKWRDFSGTAVVDLPEDKTKFWELIKSVDMIMPWHVGAYHESTYISDKWPQRIKDDMDWCTANGIEYVPVIFPGFSRFNLKGIDDGSFRPRNKGTLYWLQAQSVIAVGAKMIFQAQFDEVDEGTQVFKCVQVAPINPSNIAGSFPFMTYEEGIETDHYMWLVGKSAQMLRGEIPFTSTMPTRTVLNTISNIKATTCKVYPNPSTGNFNVSIPGSYQEATYEVYTTIGSVVKTGKFSSSTAHIDLGDVSKGKYILKINTENQAYYQKLFLTAPSP